MAQRHLDGEDENREQSRTHIRLAQPHSPHHRKQRTLPCIDKLPRICPAAEYARSKEGERYLKTYNGLVQIEVNHLANAVEVEQVKRQAALLPQTFAAFCGSSGRSVKIWVLFATPTVRAPGRKKNQAVSYRCLPARRKLLSAPAPLPRHTERTCRGAKLPHDAR